MNKKQQMITGLAALVIPLTIIFTTITKSDDAPSTTNTEISFPEVSIASRSVANHSANIETYGEARARYDVTISAEVSGRIVKILATAQSGSYISAGELLMQIEDSDYQLAVAVANRTIAEAEVALLKEERRSQQAQKEWVSAALDDTPLSDLVLRRPQLAAAKAMWLEAKASLVVAKKNLQYTKIRAPFDGVVIERLVSPRNSVTTGTPLARIVSNDRIEIRLPLTDQQWQVVSDAPGSAVELTTTGGMGNWQGYVLRKEAHINEANRQRAIIVAVDDPLNQSPPLYTGTFVTARLPTVIFEASVKLPASALSTDGYIWHLDDDDRLARFIPKTTYAFSDQIIIPLPAGYEPIKFIVRPLNSYTPKLKVKPVATP